MYVIKTTFKYLTRLLNKLYIYIYTFNYFYKKKGFPKYESVLFLILFIYIFDKNLFSFVLYFTHFIKNL